MSLDLDAVRDHYDRDHLLDSLFRDLNVSGINADSLTVAQLAQVDQLHIGGKHATETLLDRLALDSDALCLDIGCGLGGAARMAVTNHAVTVTGIDLTPSFCAAARDLNQVVGLDDRIEIIEGDATDLPFDDAAFDAAWSLHVNMNIADKQALYQEAFRVLEPGGKFIIYEIFAGHGEVHYPAPWARSKEISFLISATATRRLLADTGFQERAWWDHQAIAIDTMDRVIKKLTDTDKPVRDWQHNLAKNLTDGRITIAMALFDKPMAH
jgi:ubiquinone/menaquinone biosynthesis C-methylase UbiE